MASCILTIPFKSQSPNKTVFEELHIAYNVILLVIDAFEVYRLPVGIP